MSMKTKITSVKQAIEIITKEVGEAMSRKDEMKAVEKEMKEMPEYCVECGDRRVSHPGAHFCLICSEKFYNGGGNE